MASTRSASTTTGSSPSASLFALQNFKLIGSGKFPRSVVNDSSVRVEMTKTVAKTQGVETREQCEEELKKLGPEFKWDFGDQNYLRTKYCECCVLTVYSK